LSNPLQAMRRGSLWWRSICAIMLLALPINAEVVKLGYLYIQSESSWVVESFSQFKLAVRDVNAATVLPAGVQLNYSVYDTQGSSLQALAGAIALLEDPEVFGIVGTGYSGAAESAARFCSLKQKPMISPGSTAMSLVDKSQYPFFFRSVSSNEQQLKAILAFVEDFGWKFVAVLYSDLFLVDARIFQEEANRRGIQIISTLVVPDTDVPGYYSFQMQLPINMLRDSGARIIIALVRTVDVETMVSTARSAGLLSSGYAWVSMMGAFTNSMLASSADGGVPGWLYVQVQAPQLTSRRATFEAEWPRVSRRYNQSVDGAFDPTTGRPFYGDDIYSSTIWDTDYAPVGDGLPDIWGTFVYDTVWVFAEALANISARGIPRTDGSALRDQLLQSQFDGVTGFVSFDPVSLDRVQLYDLMNVQRLDDGSFALVKVNSEATAIHWIGDTNTAPGDGEDVEPSKSYIEAPASDATGSFVTGIIYSIVIHLRNSFNAVPPPVNFSDVTIRILDAQGAPSALITSPSSSANGELAYSCTFQSEGLLSVFAAYKGVTIQGSPMRLLVRSVSSMGVTVVRLGMLLPMFLTHEAGHAQAQLSSTLGAVIQAVRDINNKTDRVADELLPRTQLVFAYRDSKCDALAGMLGALSLTRDSFSEQGVSAIIGAGCSVASTLAAQVAASSAVPLISPSSTSPELSDSSRYPFFLRTIPSDALQLETMVDILRHLFEYSRIALVYEADDYNGELGQAFQVAWGQIGGRLENNIVITDADADFSKFHRELIATGVRVSVLIAERGTSARFIREGYNNGLGGEGYMWFGHAAMAENGWWSSDAVLAADAELQALLLRGSFAVARQPWKQTDIAKGFASRLQQLFLSKASGPTTCSLEVDDEGEQYLWAQDHDNDPSTPLACLVSNEHEIREIDAFAYDAVFAVAHALHDLIELQNRSTIVGSELVASLRSNVNFEGATGQLEFTSTSALGEREHLGDRQSGLSFSLLNYVDNVRGLIAVASWIPCSGNKPCNWAQRWSPMPDVELTFSTADNSFPRQVSDVSCPTGEALDARGNCACDVGFAVMESGLRCQRCEEGTFKSAVGDTACEPCSAGTFQPSPGSASCLDCPISEYQPARGSVECRRCEFGWSSEGGAPSCRICAEGYYLSCLRDSSCLERDCVSCNGMTGIRCGWNTTIATLNVTLGYWRHSAATPETWKCASRDSWSPCRGGQLAGHAGDGYCEPGFHGPRCELCDAEDYSQYFKADDARCHDCAAVMGRAAWVFGVVAVAVALCSIGAAVRVHEFIGSPRLEKAYRLSRKIWRKAGMRYKIKLGLGLWQCLAAVSAVFNVSIPNHLEHMARWMNVLEFPLKFGLEIVLPPSCIGSYSRRLIIGSLWPIGVVFVIACACVGWEVALANRNQGKKGIRRRCRSNGAIHLGLQRALTLSLVITFVVLPSTTTRIFKTFLCTPFEYNAADGQFRRYLRDDLTMDCDSDDYAKLRVLGFIMLAIWPVGVPLVYAVLLLKSGDAIRSGVSTPLSRSTEFLSGDYTKSAFWWEPIEMYRKLILTGAVLLIGEHAELARVLVAIITCVSFLSLHLAVRPLKRPEDGVLMTLAEMSLILVYVCVLLIKACETSAAVCSTLGFGDEASGVYQFFVFFGISMLLVHLSLGVGKLWITGYVPKILLVAKAHSVPPQTIFLRVCARRLLNLRRRIILFVGVENTLMSPRTAASVKWFRTVGGKSASPNTPPEFIQLATGVVGELHIEDVFPRTTCLVQLDIEAMAIRWAHDRFISLHTIQEVSWASRTRKARLSAAMLMSCRRSHEEDTDHPERLSYAGSVVDSGQNAHACGGVDPCAPRQRRRMSNLIYSHGHTSTVSAVLKICYSDKGGVARALELRMPEQKACEWGSALERILQTMPRVASPAHWRWALTCMAATSELGATGFIRRSDIQMLLKRANSGSTTIQNALNIVEDCKHQLDTSMWKLDHTTNTLGCWEVVQLLLRLSNLSSAIRELFTRYSPDGRMSLNMWIELVRNEQIDACATADDKLVKQELVDDSEELSAARSRFNRALETGKPDLDVLRFSLLLLDPANAAAPTGHHEDHSQPLASYWVSCSHNSYIVGDQLTGLSSADAYRRLLLQGVRQVEIDCWDGKGDPIVTHGHTFCTVETFASVIKAVAECAFVVSELPLVVSLEMHCNSKQQNKIGRMLISSLGQQLVMYDEIASMMDVASLSPLDLKYRILVKGKVRLPKEKIVIAQRSRASLLNWSSRTSRASRRKTRDSGPVVQRASIFSRLEFARTSSFVSARDIRSEGSSSNDGASYMSSRDCDEPSSARISRSPRLSEGNGDGDNDDDMAVAWESLRQKSKQNFTDVLYSSCLCIRTVPFNGYLRNLFGKYRLTMTSVNEHRLLAELGLSKSDRKQIEGLFDRKMETGIGALGLTEEQLTISAISRLAANPPQRVGNIQKMTAKRLLRPYPHGLRFSGKNMSPLPCWLVGAQSVALNYSTNDLALQLQFALFNGSNGYVLKPADMLEPGTVERGNVEDDDNYWPPPREWLHITTIELLSLHNVPKRGEQRPKYQGTRVECHKYHAELSGVPSPPNASSSSTPGLTVSIHAIGGFASVSKTLPLKEAQNELSIPADEQDGMCVSFDSTVHCCAAEPHTTFVRICALDGTLTVAYETAVLGRLRGGYRVFQLRSVLGTRIELCYLFVRISSSHEFNLWPTTRQLRLQSSELMAHYQEQSLEGFLRPRNQDSDDASLPSTTSPLHMRASKYSPQGQRAFSRASSPMPLSPSSLPAIRAASIPNFRLSQTRLPSTSSDKALHLHKRTD